MKHLELPAAADMHVHFRQDHMLQSVAMFSADCQYVLAMPNTLPAKTTGLMAKDYGATIQKHLPNTKVLTTIKLTPDTTPEMVRDAAREGVTAVKLYPLGVTNNSENGLTEEMLDAPSQRLLDCIEVMRKSGLTFCLHGEMPGHEVLTRESRFLDFVQFLCCNFPRLRVVLEHISTREQVVQIRKLARMSKVNLAATITAHHLYLTLDDILGDKIQPHHFCKPVAKTQFDRQALREAAMGGEECFFLGSDSAPHDVSTKECEHGCAGIFTAPVLVPCLIQLFEQYDAENRLPNFISGFACDFYRLDRRDTPTRRYEKITWKVQPITCSFSFPYTGNPAGARTIKLKPFKCGESINWKLVG